MNLIWKWKKKKKKKKSQIECEVLRLKKYVFWSFLVFSIKWELYFSKFSWLGDYILSKLFYVLLSVWAGIHFTGQCLGFKPKNLREKLSKVVKSSIFFATSLKHFIIHMVYAPAYLTKILVISLFLSIILVKDFCHYLE